MQSVEACPPLTGDIVYGADALARELGLTRRQIYHAAAFRNLPTFKIGAAVCARRSTIRAWIEQQERGLANNPESDQAGDR